MTFGFKFCHFLMNIPFKKTFPDNSETLLRRSGYAKQQDFKMEKISYFRSLGGNHFPKFHVYVDTESPLVLSLHLDNKAHAYAGQRAHGGDYDSEVVRVEALRLWNAINGQEKHLNVESAEKKPAEAEKKGFWSGLFD